ncbi:hypothetical protein B0H19DRAFT_598169 [Mycena capillaripes]|nr:hypothetical protein B0H19DRAFT_598169 [Mycena capillaripes]
MVVDTMQRSSHHGIAPPVDNLVVNQAAERAFSALYALKALNDSELRAGPDLWPRIWAWIEFLHTYRDFYPPFSSGLDGKISAHLLYFLDRFASDSNTVDLIRQTIGVRTVVMHAWASLVDSQIGPDHIGFSQLRNFFCSAMLPYDPHDLEKILESAGGPEGVAAIVVKTFKLFIPNRHTPISEKTLRFIEGPLVFLLDLKDSGGIISPALISGGVVSVLTTAACAISKSHGKHPNALSVLLDIFDVLHGLFSVPTSYKTIRSAIKMGLLRAIIFSGIACRDTDNIESTGLWKTLDVTLPTATVFYTVVAQLEGQLADVESLISAPSFQQSPICGRWRSFEAVAHDRIALVKALASKDYVPVKACDNMECNIIRARTAFRRCAHCREVYYCSAECQKLDWNHDKHPHREACDSLRTFNLSLRCVLSPRHFIDRYYLETGDVGARNMRFMRALLRKDVYSFVHVKGGAYFKTHIAYLQQYPSRPRVTIMDYARGNPSLSVKLADEEREEDQDQDVYWNEHIARAVRSGGLMELHLMVVLDGNKTRRWMFPGRSNSPAVHDGLIRIAKEIPPDSEATEKICALLEANPSVITIH